MKNIAQNKITVMLVDDHALVREGLRLILESQTDIQVVAEARNGREAVEMVTKLKPDVVVMDIAMPLLNGFEASRQIINIAPAAKILILSAYNDDEYIERLMEMGAKGYLVKQSCAQDLSKAIREVTKGNTFFGPSVKKRFENKNLKVMGRNGILKKKKISLSSRETEVLQLIAEGSANKQIASELKISIKTVEKHRQHLMEKLNIHDTAGLTRHAISSGVIENSSQSTIR